MFIVKVQFLMDLFQEYEPELFQMITVKWGNEEGEISA